MKLKLCENIRKLRKEKGLTQEKLAEILDVIYIGHEDKKVIKTLAEALDQNTEAPVGSDRLRQYKFANRLKMIDNTDLFGESRIEKAVGKLWDIRTLWEEGIETYQGLSMPPEERKYAIAEFYDETGIGSMVDALYQGIPVEDLTNKLKKSRH